MVAIATRTSWGARHKNGDLTLTGLAGEVFLHHTVTTQLPATASVAQERAQMRNLEQIGQNRFRTGISYNVVIFPSGRAYQGVSWNRRGTHTGGRNSTSRSIAFAGNTDVHHPTAAQIATARSIYHHGRGRWWTAAAPLRTHRDVAATACAGRHAIARLPDIRRPLPAPSPGPSPAPPAPPAFETEEVAMFVIANQVPGHPQHGTAWICIPQGNGGPRATVLFGDPIDGLPLLRITNPSSWAGVERSIQWA